MDEGVEGMLTKSAYDAKVEGVANIWEYRENIFKKPSMVGKFKKARTVGKKRNILKFNEKYAPRLKK